MELLVASAADPAGLNMARAMAGGDIHVGEPAPCGGYEVMLIGGPAISADSLEDSLSRAYDGIVFLSRHAAASGALALTCHSTGNFADAKAGGRERELAVPHAQLAKRYVSALWARRSEFAGFQVTLEATHHGPTALRTPSIFVEVGTGEAQWRDEALCARVAGVLREALRSRAPDAPEAVAFGGTHYPARFTAEAAAGRHAIGTVVPRHALEHVDGGMMEQIAEKNPRARTALVEWGGMGPHKRRVLRLISDAGLEVVRA